MKKHIAEELPERKHAPAVASSLKQDNDKKEGGKTPDQRVKQAVYDIRYRARREELPLRQAYSQYMQNSSMGQQEKTMVKQKLFGKGGIQAEDFNIADDACSHVANALFKVFVEGVEKEETIHLTYMEKLETAEHRKYKVRVTGKDGRSYVRYADRQKISELRANPNIESVEMTGYGEPYEGEKNKGEQTAAVKSGQGLAKKDFDGDGKTESPAKEYRGVVHNAIQRKRGQTPDGKDTSNVKEEFLADGSTYNPDANSKEIKPMKEGEKNIVKINPDVPGNSKRYPSLQLAHTEVEGEMIAEKAVSRAQQAFMALVYKAKKGEKPASPEVEAAAKGMTKKEAKKFAKTKHKGLPGHVKEAADCGSDDKEKERDTRGDYAKINLLKNKLRAMGAKNPIVMVANEEVLGETEDKERKGTDYRGRDYGTGKQNKTIPPEGVMQGGWLEREKLKKA